MVILHFFPNLPKTSWKYKNGGRVTSLFAIGYFFVLTKDDSLRVAKWKRTWLLRSSYTKSLVADSNDGLPNKIAGNCYFHPAYSLCVSASLLMHTSKPYHMLLPLPRTQSSIPTPALTQLICTLLSQLTWHLQEAHPTLPKARVDAIPLYSSSHSPDHTQS